MSGKNLTRAAKRALAFTAAAMMAASALPAAALASAVDEPLLIATAPLYYGDVDMDGTVAASDALLVLKDVVKLSELTDETAIALADMDGDGSLTASDALAILRTVVELTGKKAYYGPAASETPATEEATATPAAAATETPAATVKPTATPAASAEPTASVTPTINPAWLPNAIPTVEPGETYAGTKAAVVAANGATVDETTGIVTYTDENTANEKGVQFENPLAGRTDLRQTVEEALAGQPAIESLTSSQTTIYDPDATYPIPKWTNGVSYSFWLKADWKSATRPDASPLLVLTQNETYYKADGNRNEKAAENFTLMVTMMGTVRFESGDTPHNSFRADSYCALNAVNNDWNYYTVTIANDWITVYINGQENVYKQVLLNKDKGGIEFFNDGFMTRYSTIGAPTEEDAAADIRGYITPYVGDAEAGLIGNSRYANPGYFDGYDTQLLVNYATDPDTQLWIGGTETSKLISPMQDLGPASYSLRSGTQVADVQGYDKELTAAEVAANYAAATRPDGTPVTPAESEAPAESEEPAASAE